MRASWRHGHDEELHAPHRERALGVGEYRLIPTAATVWAVTLVLLLTPDAYWWLHLAVAAALIGVVAVVVFLAREPAQAVLISAVALGAATMTQLRMSRAQAHDPPPELTGKLAGSAREFAPGSWLLSMKADQYPETIAVFVDTHRNAELEIPGPLVAGTKVAIKATYSESTRAGLSDITATARTLEIGEEPVTAGIRQAFREKVIDVVGESSQGLVPGMVLGDTSLQDEAEQARHIASGLSHLSAVSGANVAVVTVSVVLICRLFGLGPRIQIGAAAGALSLFVLIVGPEPSVLRAAVMVVVGLLAVWGSQRMPAIHGLALAVIGLVCWQPDLAVQWGFALSVSATAGIIALTPMLYRGLAKVGSPVPDILIRAIAVTVAAEVVTAPLVSAMAGAIPLTSVAANVVVAPVVTPVTVLGLIAVVVMLIWAPLATIFLLALEPCTWFIATVSTVAARVPVVEVSPVWVILGWCWMILAVMIWRAMAAMVAVVMAATWVWLTPSHAAVVPLTDLRVIQVESTAEVAAALERAPDSQVVIVTDPTGRAKNRPSITPDGRPVLFINRDGPVTVHEDGQQHARDGRF